MTAVLSLQQQLVSEDPVLAAAILEILDRPSRHPISLKELRKELHGYCDEERLEHCLSTLLERRLIEPVWTSGYEVGLRKTTPKGPAKHFSE